MKILTLRQKRARHNKTEAETKADCDETTEH